MKKKRKEVYDFLPYWQTKKLKIFYFSEELQEFKTCLRTLRER